MAAFVVLPASADEETSRPGARLNIFPGSATPAVMTARRAVLDRLRVRPRAERAGPGGQLGERRGDEVRAPGGRRPVSLDTDLTVDGGRAVSKLSVAAFPDGLAAGWHRFSGRWYEAGSLVLTSERSIEFVER